MRPPFGQLAQLVEQRIENPRVRGSIPRLATKRFKQKSPVSEPGFFAFRLGRERFDVSAGRVNAESPICGIFSS